MAIKLTQRRVASEKNIIKSLRSRALVSTFLFYGRKEEPNSHYHRFFTLFTADSRRFCRSTFFFFSQTKFRILRIHLKGFTVFQKLPSTAWELDEDGEIWKVEVSCSVTDSMERRLVNMMLSPI